MTSLAPKTPASGYYTQSQRPHPARYLGAYTELAFVLESVQFIWKTIVGAQRQSPYSKVLIGLSGGSTPKKVLKTLASLCSNETGEFCIRRPSSQRIDPEPECATHECAKIDWSRVAVFLVDERFVPPTHNDSNQKMIRETLLSHGMHDDKYIIGTSRLLFLSAGIPILEENIVFPDTTKPIDECVSDYESRLRRTLASTGRPRLVVLGMGDDGHIASWFPPLSSEEYATAHSPHHLVHHNEQDR
ncbi:bifunctional glucose-6-phosphate 1-dehydrogenase/6-phosphogluconolactonase-like, partial [Condylostylus longicornis]|uniref:bifunctional glucose-6-phosphate 1-dehydrogenase/6-phosphogluconolactonase-like n=1 Tax=Condylostylus longicornis TaxID=2530218 RepID=UPI00244E5598